MEEIDLFPRKNGRRNTEELILSILQKTRNELKTNVKKCDWGQKVENQAQLGTKSPF